MRVHANAKLGPAGRLALVRKSSEGWSFRAAADESSVSVATAHRWWHRWLEADATARERGVAAGPLKPAASPAATHERGARGADLRCRRAPGATGQSHATVGKVL